MPQLLRGSIAAGIATFVALSSHVASGGTMPALLGILVPLLLSWCLCVLLSGRSLSLPRLSVSVIASQALFHALFVLGSPIAAGASRALSAVPQHHAHALTVLPTGQLSEHTMLLMRGGLLMWLGHLAAAAVTILALYRGERSVRTICQVVRQLLASLGAQVQPSLLLTIPVRPAVPLLAGSSDWSVLSRLRESCVTRRGPPVSFHTTH